MDTTYTPWANRGNTSSASTQQNSVSTPTLNNRIVSQTAPAQTTSAASATPPNRAAIQNAASTTSASSPAASYRPATTAANNTSSVAAPQTSVAAQTPAASRAQSYATQAANSMAQTPSAVSPNSQYSQYSSMENAQMNGIHPIEYFSGNYNLTDQAPVATSAAAITPQQVKISTDYINQYNADREAKIRDMYAGNLATQNAGLKTALDTNLGNLKTAYDQNLGNLRTAYDNNTGSLKTAYDKNLAQIANTYQQNLSDAEAARAQISPQYQESMNALGAEYERLRRNGNMQAAVNGLNTGAGTQLALGQSMAYQRNQGNLARSENEALNEAERGIQNLGRNYRNQQDILNTEYANNVDRLNREYQNQIATYGTTYQNNLANMKTNYENQIAQAAANNNYQQAAALLDEYGAQYDRMQQQAALLAQYGDFSAYADMYGQQAADTMKQSWAMQNPDIAWATGNLKAEDYFALTGKYPNDPNNNMWSMRFGGIAGLNTGATGYYNGVQEQPQNDLFSAYYSNYWG